MGRFAFLFVILGCFNLDVELIYPLKKYDRNFLHSSGDILSFLRRIEEESATA